MTRSEQREENTQRTKIKKSLSQYSKLQIGHREIQRHQYLCLLWLASGLGFRDCTFGVQVHLLTEVILGEQALMSSPSNLCDTKQFSQCSQPVFHVIPYK